MKPNFFTGLGKEPYYSTSYGQAYLGDARELLQSIPSNKVNLILTSPPFALTRKKAYDNVSPEKYVEWFLPFARQFKRILSSDGSLVIHLGGSWKPGYPVKNLYQFKLLIALCEELKFYLAQDVYWYNTAKLPAPAQWVTVKRVRLKDAVDNIWWLSKTTHPKACNRSVLKPYSTAMKELFRRGYNSGPRPSGHNISDKFAKNNKGAIPSNLINVPNTRSQSRYLRLCKKFKIAPHPARFPIEIPSFFIRLLTDEGDVVLDPFAGSNVTGEAAEKLKRYWISFEIKEEYVKGSMLRFFDTPFP